MNTHQVIREHIFKTLGMASDDKMPDLPEIRANLRRKLRRTDELMENRLVMGAFRYGGMERGTTMQFDIVGSCMRRLGEYEATGNSEHLLDVANLCRLLFSALPESAMSATDGGEHVPGPGRDN